jgi:hypothetical protein
MYRGKDPNQLELEGFTSPFGKLNANNRWVKQAELTPWDLIEESYAKNFTPNVGVPAISARIAFGAIYIKESKNLTDRETVEYIIENPYAQYYLGLNEYREDKLFDASMMVHFRKRFPAEVINEINIRMHVESAKIPTSKKTKKPEKAIAVKAETPIDPPTHKGHLQLDATCAPADIRYPSDLSLLNEARGNLEEMIDELWHLTDRVGHKTDYSRKKARNGFLAMTKQKQPRHAKLRKEIRYQLDCIIKNITTISDILLVHGLEVLKEKRIARLLIICELHRQQQQMYKDKTHSVDNRIVSLRQPHIRPIVRGKAGRKYEFGQKVSTSVINDYTFIERQSYDNFNEGTTLKESVERYKTRFGYYPEAVLADQLYRNRENLRYCKKHGIRLSGPALGRPRSQDSKVLKALARQDSSERNMIEGRYGIAKRRYGMGRLLAYLPETAQTQVAMQILCMNMDTRLRFILDFILCLLKTLFGNFNRKVFQDLFATV